MFPHSYASTSLTKFCLYQKNEIHNIIQILVICQLTQGHGFKILMLAQIFTTPCVNHSSRSWVQILIVPHIFVTPCTSLLLHQRSGNTPNTTKVRLMHSLHLSLAVGFLVYSIALKTIKLREPKLESSPWARLDRWDFWSLVVVNNLSE